MPDATGHVTVSVLEDVRERIQFHCPGCDHAADATLRLDGRKHRWKIGSFSPHCPGGRECLAAIADTVRCRPYELLNDPVAHLERLAPSRRPGRAGPAEQLPSEDEVADWHARLIKSGKARRRLYAMGFLDATLARFEIGYGSFHGRPRAFMQPVRNEHGELVQLVESYWPELMYDLATDKEHKSHVLGGRGTALYPLSVLAQPSRRPLAVLCLTAGRWKAPLMIQVGFDAVTAITGTDGWKKHPEWARHFEGRCVAVIYDVNEEAKARQRATEFRAAGIDAWAVRLSRDGLVGKDGVDDYLRSRSSKRLRALIRRERTVTA